jgi:hypothetical protein
VWSDPVAGELVTAVGSVVSCGARRYQLISRAAPSGYWAVAVGGGPVVRLAVSKGTWRKMAERDRVLQ